MQSNFRIFFLALVFFHALGCSHARKNLGISKLEWESYSKSHRNALASNFNTMVEERRAMVSRNTENLIYHGYLNVEIRNGKAMFPPDFITWQTYRPVNFRIPCNQCQEIALLNEFNSKLEAKLEICFFENALYIDPSTHDTDKLLGSLAIYWSPLWQSGFNYENVSSTGRVKLNDVTIEVHQINED